MMALSKKGTAHQKWALNDSIYYLTRYSSRDSLIALLAAFEIISILFFLLKIIVHCVFKFCSLRLPKFMPEIDSTLRKTLEIHGQLQTQFEKHGAYIPGESTTML